MENDSTFVAPEGVYSLTDEHKLSPIQIIAVSGGLAVYPSKFSTVSLKFANAKPSGNSAGFTGLLGGGNKQEGKKDKAEKHKDREDGVSMSSSDTPDGSEPSAPSGQDNVPAEQHTLFSNPTQAGKKKPAPRPRHNLRTTSSSFITRIQTAEGITKTLQSKQGDVTFVFFNVAKTLVWVEAGSKAKEPLSRITFSAHPTCHDVNLHTAAPDHLDIIIGFNTGDLVWIDPITARYARLNKAAAITNSPCTSVRWVPSSSTLFLASHADGTIIVYDVEREDGTFTPHEPTNSGSNHPDSDSSSHEPWDPTDSIFVTMPPWHPVSCGGNLNQNGKAEKEKIAKNPVSHWRISRKAVVDFVFSPDVKYVAAISEDGCLRVIDTLAEQLVDCYSSYFGALTAVAWSPDGRYILTGGQDDLLTLFSPWEQRVVARCQAHSSFVSAVAFDESRCDGRTYRFGSVGEDNKLIFWDFSSGALHRPKYQAMHQRMSMSSSLSLTFRHRSVQYLPSATNSPALDHSPSVRFHPSPSRNEIGMVQPVLVKQLDGEVLNALQFLSKSILTANKAGHIKLWIRPFAPRSRHGKNRGLSQLDTQVM